MMVGKVKFWLG